MNGIMDQWWKLGGACGLLFIIIFMVVGFGIQGDAPSYSDDVDTIRAYWEDDGETFLIGEYVIGLAVLLLFVPFLAALRALLGIAEGGAQLLSRIAFAGGIIFVIMTAAAAASWTTLAFAAEELEDESIRLLMFLDVGAWNAVTFPAGILLIASSIVIFRTGVLWRWLAFLGVVVGIAALIAPCGIIDISPAEDPEDSAIGLVSFIAFLGLALWTLLMSIAMIMKPVVVSMGPRDADTASIEATQPPA